MRIFLRNIGFICLLAFPNLSKAQQPELAYSFFVAGHVYGTPKGSNLGVYHAFKKKFDYIKAQPKMKFGVFTGDIVRTPTVAHWDSIDADIKELGIPVHFAPGNHDAAHSEFYQSRYGKTFKNFKVDYADRWHDDIVILDPLKQGWSISDEQLEMFLKSSKTSTQQKNLFVFTHQLIWWTPNNIFRYMLPNSVDGLKLPTNYWGTVEPMLQQSAANEVYLFAGDVGANPRFNSINYHKSGKIHYIAQGMGGRYRDNFIIVDVYKDGAVKTRIIPLNSEQENALGELSDYAFLNEGRKAKKAFVNSGKVVAFFDLETPVGVQPQYSSDSLLKFYSHGFYSDSMALSGTHSIRLDSNQRFGLTVKTKSFKPGERYRVSAWRLGPSGSIVVSGTKKEYGFYEIQPQVAGWTKNNWNKLSLEFIVPQGIPENEIVMYFMYDGKQEVFFDDFKIEQIEDFERSEVPLSPVVSLHLDSAAMQQLHKTRKRALDAGVLMKKKEDWVEGVLTYEDKEFPIELRLKGDWLDHLILDKWSFRIKIKNEQKAKWGNSVFSFHTPAARDFMKEWIFHKLLEQEGVLTTKYDFVPLYLNGENLGTYAYEEHFGSDMLERNNLPVTPILKFDEDGFWQIQQFNLGKPSKKQVTEKYYPIVEGAEIVAFQDKKMLNNRKQYNYFLKGREKLNAFRFNSAPVSTLVDLDKWARFLALCDLTASYHGLAWHNMRYYYNPDTKLLEPIAYDGNPTMEHYEYFSPFLKKIGKETFTLYDRSKWMYYSLFNDTSFVRLYLNYLEQYSQPAYLDQFFTQHQSDIYTFQSAFRFEFANYYYETFITYIRAANFIKWMQYKERVLKQSVLFNFQHRLDWFKEHPETPEKYLPKTKPSTPFEKLSLCAYIQKKKRKTMEVMVYNYHHTPLQLTKALEGKTVVQELTDSIPAYHYKTGPGKLCLTLPSTCKKLEFVQPERVNEKYKAKVYPWPALDIPSTD